MDLVPGVGIIPSNRFPAVLLRHHWASTASAHASAAAVTMTPCGGTLPGRRGVGLRHEVRHLQRRRRRRQRLRRAELRRLPGQLQRRQQRMLGGRSGKRRRRVPPGVAAERLHLHGPQTLLPQALLVAPLQPALQEAAEAAQHDHEGPDQPEAGETGQEGVGALRHHHGGGGSGREVAPPPQLDFRRTGWGGRGVPLSSGSSLSSSH
ncbi:hypothetical protein EYF80_025170 [Liparis tanakae]|uniref:Uncharacterized protein n=1 Tax=Liparis tanakae TaxID=230148 RepID=A0A4Z2HGD3_9TELE|nr:hypothetical protein EYF80_025170 [Liparis tanakae]